MPHAMGDVISVIVISIAVADSIGNQARAWYRSNPTRNSQFQPAAERFVEGR